MPEPMQEAEALQARIGYRFHNAALLTQALTHPSRMKEANNQRLEFLGDSVLGLLIAELLYQLYPEAPEGDLTKRQSLLVRSEALTQVAHSIALGEALRLGQSEVQGDGRGKASNLEDACEALIGALYLDGGLEAARAFVQRHWAERARIAQATLRDAKTRLQELVQGRGLPLPAYRLEKSEGPAHAPHFVVAVEVQGQAEAAGEGSNKRQAEQAAATAMLARLEKK